VACSVLLLALVGAFLLGRPGRLPAADFTFVLPQENYTLDPAHASSFSDGIIIQALFEGLVRLDPVTLEPRPGAAERFGLSDDARTCTFHLRPDARWSDGRALTAQDFAFAWRRILDPTTASRNTQFLRPIDRIETPDAHTLLVHLREPCPYFPALTAHFVFMPVRQDVIEQHGDRWTRTEHLIGNGPYRMELRRIRDRVRLVRNDGWHASRKVGDGHAPQTIDALAVDATATALNLFLTGNADWLNVVPPNAIPLLRAHRNPDELRLGTVLGTNFLRFNATAHPLNDVRVRRAIDLAIDREAICQWIYKSGEQPARTFVPPALSSSGMRPPDVDAQRARQLLSDAGYPGGQGLPELELLFPAQEAPRAVAEALSEQLRETLGIRLRPVPQEFKVYIDSQQSLKYQVCLASWIGDYPDATSFLDVFRSDSASNRTGWHDAAYDALLDQAAAIATTAGMARRAELLARAEALLLEQGPIAPIAFRAQANLVASHVDGFTSNALDWHPLEDIRIRRP